MPKKSRTIRLFKEIAKNVAPPPDITVSQWADQFRRLSPEASAEPGQWNTNRTPYLREILNAVSDHYVEKVVMMSSSQVGKTEVSLNVIGYFIDIDPSPMMLVQPTLELAQAYSKDRLAPMLRDTPALRGKVKDVKNKDSGNTMLHKVFPGGHITLSGANSPASLASRPIRIVLLDEVDRYPASAGTEGDPVTLVSKRTTTFLNRKQVLVSTPTIKGASRIESEYDASTMEQWCYACPGCGEYQPLTWGQIKFDYDQEANETISVNHACRLCGELNGEFTWKEQNAKWIARRTSKSRGFHLNELSSPWKRWTEIVKEFVAAKRGGPERLKAWVNTSLGESWEEEGEGVEKEGLIKRREQYGHEIPNDALILTAGVDVQDNRLEYEIVGWGTEQKSWGIKYGVIMGDPGQPFVWKMLDDAVINKTFVRGDKQKMKVMTTCIDSGGHFAQQVYQYCKERELKRVWAIKGRGGSGVPFINRPKRRNEAGAWLFVLGVDAGKDTVASRLKVDFANNPGYCHFPVEEDRGYDDDYFEGLTAEQRVVRFVKGQASVHWEKKRSGARNEPFDIRNYATAAFEILDPPLDELKKQFEIQAQTKEAETTSVQSPTKRRTGLVNKGIQI